MIHGIAAPVQGRTGEGRQRFGQATGHVLGGVVGGAITAVGVWGLLSPLRVLPGVIVIGVAVLGVLGLALADAGAFRLPAPQGQVPQRWYSQFGASRSYALYGAFLGTGVFTFVPYNVVYSVFLLAGLQAHAVAGMILGSAFGFARSVTVVTLARPRWAGSFASSLAYAYRRVPIVSASLGGVLAVAVLLAVAP